MLSLLLSTLEMMALTFIIGFVVAGVILGLDVVNNEEDVTDDEREEFRRGVNSDLLHIKPSGYYHGVSHGASHLDLMDYYYPQDTRIMYLKKEEQLMRKNNTNKKENPSIEK